MKITQFTNQEEKGSCEKLRVKQATCGIGCVPDWLSTLHNLTNYRKPEQARDDVEKSVGNIAYFEAFAFPNEIVALSLEACRLKKCFKGNECGYSSS